MEGGEGGGGGGGGGEGRRTYMATYRDTVCCASKFYPGTTLVT